VLMPEESAFGGRVAPRIRRIPPLREPEQMVAAHPGAG
jgi:hypothetical protein